MAKKKDSLTRIEAAAFVMSVIGCFLGMLNTAWNMYSSVNTYADRVELEMDDTVSKQPNAYVVRVNVINNGRVPVSVRRLRIVQYGSNDEDSNCLENMHPTEGTSTLIPAAGIESFQTDTMSEYDISSLENSTSNDSRKAIVVEAQLNDGTFVRTNAGVDLAIEVLLLRERLDILGNLRLSLQATMANHPRPLMLKPYLQLDLPSVDKQPSETK